MDTVYLDIETTGLCPEQDKIVDIALIDDYGDVLLESLVNPLKKIPFHITAINGISDHDVAYAPLLDEIINEIEEECKGKTLIVYNASFDLSFLPSLKPAKIKCAMQAFTRFYCNGGEEIWYRLAVAAHILNYEWAQEQIGHRALSQVRACRHVWKSMPIKIRDQIYELS